MKCVYVLVALLAVGLECRDVKSSLTIVIDHSYSMTDDIEQVRLNADALFDTVMNSNASQIEDFVLVGFSDPVFELRTVTKDRQTFKDAIRNMKADNHPNGDCPEMALSGIELALKSSREASFLFVYTDASAKDYNKKLNQVISLSQKMRSQVVFVLTGDCGDRRSKEYLAFRKLARATQGQVFHMEKKNMGEIFNYVKYTIESRKNVIASTKYPAGYRKFDVNVDGDTKELVISVSGTNPSVEVTDSDGTKVPTKDLTRLPQTTIVNVSGVKPGVYKVEVGSESEMDVLVTGTTTVHFQHGFSVFQPTAITETATRPVPGEKSYISIKLDTEVGKVELHTIQILDMNNKVVLETPLKLLDAAEQFYTTSPVLPPNDMFRIAIKGYHNASKTYITRISLTPIEPQKTTIVDLLGKAPEVSIDGAVKVEAKYNEELQLKCKVSGYPKPDIIWESDDPTAVLSHTVSVVELPYEFISFLHVEKVNKSSVYTCKAVNKLNSDSKSIAVELKNYFIVVEKPRDIAIEYQKSGQVFCKASAFPPATASWYRGRRPLVSNAAARLSADNSSLTIRSMEPRLAGEYICEIRNDFHRKVMPFFVSLTGVEKPKINKTNYFIAALIRADVNITCDVIGGKPKPSIAWFYREDLTPFGKLIRLGETAAALRIRDVETEHGGLYRCVATNVVGEDHHDIDLDVQYPPSRSAITSERVAAGEGDTVSLPCPAAGAPPPAFTWRRDGAALPPARYTVFRDGTLRFTASLNDSGHYDCEARNVHGATHINVNVQIFAPVDIEPPAASRVTATMGAAVVLPCRARGRPAPRLAWLFHSRDPAAAPVHYAPSDSSGSLHIKTIQTEQDGSYTCVASNDASSMNITYTVDVLAPPSISYAAKRFVGVAGDAVLRLPCRAAGRPAPAVSWARGGLPVPVGSPWYALAADGALLLRDLDARAAGRYVCRAKNNLGTVAEVFEAVVLPAPAPASPRASEWFEEGQAAAVPCAVPRRRTDRLIWFKDGRVITDEELVFRNVSRSDAGLYTCRVSSVSGAQTGSTQVEVGWKPRFVYDDKKDIEFEIGNLAFLPCEATGEPKPQVQWFHDDVPLDVTSFTHEVEMSGPRDKGRYTCVVSNKFGSVQQEFEIATVDCALDIKKDFDGNTPLILTRFLELYHFDNSDGQVHISRGESIVLICPAGFINIPQNRINVKCVNGKQFVSDGNDSKRLVFSDFKCRQKVVPEVKKTGIRCTNGDSELISVGFPLPRLFIEIYQICLDRATQNTIYTKQIIRPTEDNVLPEYNIEWFDSVNLDRLYDCSHQSYIISSVLGKVFHRSDGCCFGRRQLVSPRDLAPGPPQAAAYTALNVAPQWGTCNSQNWEELEARVRELARAARRRLTVWSGVARSLWLRDAAGAPWDVYLSDGRDYHQVPELFWKVVQDPASNSSLAVVQVNVPDVEDVQDYHLCPDVCSQIGWMHDRRWRRVERGYTYCCRLEDFERALRLRGAFPPRRALLQAAARLAGSEALHL